MNSHSFTHRTATVNRPVRAGRLALASAAALALVWGGALPALAADDAPKRDALIAAEASEALIVAGETVALSVEVSKPEGLGVPTPTGTVSLVSGAVIVASADLEGEQAVLTVRPLAADEYNLNIAYSGDSNYAPATIGAPSFTVTATPVALNLAFDDSPVVYGGASGLVYVTLTSGCASDEDPDVLFRCNSVYGSPSGMVTLTAVHPDTGDVMHTQSREVLGSTHPGVWADPAAELTAEESSGLFILEVPIPDIQLGSPSTWDFRASFSSDNWFADAGMMPHTAEILPASTSIDLYVGDSALTPVAQVTGPVQLTALVSSELFFAAPFSGTIDFFANGELIVGQVPIENEFGALITWTPTTNGIVDLTAEFVPATLNHIGSASTAKTVTVALPQSDGGDQRKPVAAETLAQTGAGESAAIAGAMSLALMLAGVALLGARRLSRQ